jgi:drug/metabolite transporter (DMT)-like permease
VRGSRSGGAAVLAAVTIWAFTNTLIKLSPVPALSFAAHRIVLGALLLLVVSSALGRRLTWAQIRASAPGGVVLGLEISFFFSAIKHTSIADVSVISALQPALVMLVAGPIFGERVTRGDVGLALVALAGVGLVILGSSGTPAWSLFGDLLAGGSLVCWSAYFLVSKRARETVPTLEYTSVVFAVAALVVTPLAVLSGQPLGGLRAADWGLLALFVLGASSGHLLVAWAHSSVDVSVSSLLTLAQPVLGSIAALVILGEPITPVMVLGGAIVVLALVAIVRRATWRAEELEPDLPQT